MGVILRDYGTTLEKTETDRETDRWENHSDGTDLEETTYGLLVVGSHGHYVLEQPEEGTIFSRGGSCICQYAEELKE